jgi:hypothetical protein
LEEHVGSIFRVEEYAEQEISAKADGKHLSCLAYSAALKMKTTFFSVTSVDF